MTTTEKTQTVLNQRLTDEGFIVDEYSYELPYHVENPNLHLDITKLDNVKFKCHVELDADEKVVEAFIEVLDENGDSYVGKDMTLFVENDDVDSVDALVTRLNHVFS